MQLLNEAPLQTLVAAGGSVTTGVTVMSTSTGVPAVSGVIAPQVGSLTSASLTGMTVNGDALSVSVDSLGDASDNATSGGRSGVSVVVAQYN